MPKRVIRPSAKFAMMWYFLVTLLLALAAWLAYGMYLIPFAPWHLAALLLFLVPIRRHIATLGRSLTLEGDHLTFETGLFSKTRRTVDLSKVQDVTARQSVMGRLLSIGDLRVETAGESSAISVEGIDDPRGVADTVLARSRELTAMRSHPAP